MEFIKDFLSSYRRDIDEMVNSNIEQFDNLTNTIKQKLDSGGRVLIISAGKNAVEMENLLETFRFYFKMPNEDKLRVVVAGRRYSITETGDKWKHYESNESIGAIHSQELDLNSNDMVLALSVSKETKYILSFMKNSKTYGVTTAMISSPLTPKEKFDYVDVDIELQNTNDIIKGTFLSEGANQIKFATEAILYNLFQKEGQIYDGYIMTTRLWTERLRELSIDTIKHFIPDYDFNLYKKDLEECDNELSILLVKNIKNISADEAKEILEKEKYNFKKII